MAAGAKLVIAGAEPIELGEKIITKIGFRVETPGDSNARSTDVAKIISVEGRIIPEIAGSAGEPVAKVHQWAHVKTGPTVYRSAELTYQGDSTTQRKYTLPKAYVLSYNEDFSDREGTGTFKLELCQKKDENKNVKIEGGFAAE